MLQIFNIFLSALLLQHSHQIPFGSDCHLHFLNFGLFGNFINGVVQKVVIIIEMLVLKL